MMSCASLHRMYLWFTADWTSASLRGREHEYTYQWTSADTAELDGAVQKIKPQIRSEDDVLQVT